MYKEYNIDQLILPLDVEVFVPKNHLCRLLVLIIDFYTPYKMNSKLNT